MTDLDEMREQYQTGGHSLAAATAYINGLEAENEQLKCCGNCGHYNVSDGLGWHGDPDVDAESCAASHGDACHFTPSRWTRREE